MPPDQFPVSIFISRLSPKSVLYNAFSRGILEKHKSGRCLLYSKLHAPHPTQSKMQVLRTVAMSSITWHGYFIDFVFSYYLLCYQYSSPAHWLVCCFSNTRMLLPQGLWTCCSLCLHSFGSSPLPFRSLTEVSPSEGSFLTTKDPHLPQFQYLFICFTFCQDTFDHHTYIILVNPRSQT